MAFERRAWASSENGVNTTVATVDGDADTCFSTAVETSPWWTADIGEEHRVSAVVIHTTSDTTGD